MFTQPKPPLPGRITPQVDGSVHMLLIPEDGMRVEYCWGEDGERLLVGEPIRWSIEAGLIESTLPAGHEWILWQWHAPDEPSLAHSNPFMRLLVRDGVGYLQALHEFSTPYDKAKQVQVELATVELKPGKRYTWNVEAMIGKDGYVRIRKDGLLVADYAGPFGFDFTGMKGPYAKAGIYKWDRNWLGRIVANVRIK